MSLSLIGAVCYSPEPQRQKHIQVNADDYYANDYGVVTFPHWCGTIFLTRLINECRGISISVKGIWPNNLWCYI